MVREFDRIVAKAKGDAPEVTPRDHWWETLAEAEAMVAAIKATLSDDERRKVLADDLHCCGSAPVLLKAVVAPQAEEPPITMLDAKKISREERVAGATGRNQAYRLDRVGHRIQKAAGPLDKLPLVDLKREQAAGYIPLDLT
jgi:hypothetical protein